MSTPPPRLQSPRFSRAPLAGLVALTAALSVWSWLRVDGTIFADAVEYLERAQAFVRGEPLVDAQKIRAAGVSLLHAPALWIADTLGISDSRWVLPYAAACHVAIACAFVLLIVRLATALARWVGFDAPDARAAGLLAGLVAAVSPTFLQFSAIAMTDIAAGAALAYGFERALYAGGAGSSPLPGHDRPSNLAEARIGLQAGLGLGLALLAAFKTIPLILLGGAGALLTGILVRGFRATLPRFGAALVALTGFALLQCAFDAWTYGGFGSGLGTYVLANFGPTAGTFLWNLGLIDLGRSIYGMGATALGNELVNGVSSEASDLSSAQNRTFYLDHFEWFLARWLVPAIALGAVVAAWKSVRTTLGPASHRPKRAAAGRLVAALTPLALALVFALVSSRKGAKEIRLWLPILPIFAAYGGLGLVALAGGARSLAARPRAALVALALVAATVHGPWTLRKDAPREMAALARAADWIRNAVPVGLDRRPVVTASFHWSVLFRTPPSWDLVKLPHQLDKLKLQSPEERAATLAALGAVDAFIVHAALLTAEDHPGDVGAGWAQELFDVVAEEFHVAAAFWDRADEQDVRFGPILVLTKSPVAGEERRVLASRGPAAPQWATGLTSPVRLERPLEGTVEQLELAGARVIRLPGDGLFWAEFDVEVRSERVVADYAVALRISDESGTRGYTTFRRPRWGKGSTSELSQGTRWTEGYLLAPQQGPQDGTVSPPTFEPGSQVWLWWDLVTVDGDGAGGLRVTGRLDATRGSPGGAGLRRSPTEGALLIGSFAVESEATTPTDRLRLEGSLSDQ